MRAPALVIAALVLASGACRSSGGGQWPARPAVRADVIDGSASSFQAQAPARLPDVVAIDAARAPVDAGCVEDEDCRVRGRVGRCFSAGLAAQYTQAFRDCAEGRAWRATHHVGQCVYDECRDDFPAGDTCARGTRCASLEMVSFPQRVCITASCDADRECRRHVTGRCVAYLRAGHCVRGGWGCSYSSDECVPRDPVHMCPVHPGMLTFCAPRAGHFACIDEPVVVPDSGTE